MQVKVWNRNTHPFKQDWNGQSISIAAKGFILMEEGEAHEFLGSYSPVIRDGGGQPDPRFKKDLIIEKISEKKEGPSPEDHTCNKCGIPHATKEDLEKHIDLNHLDDLEDQEVATKRRGRQKKEAA
jgi:hypothetical protein